VVEPATGRVLGRDHNRREVLGDPTAHAEILALRAAASVRGHWRLDDTVVIVTLEPCPMCAGALVNSRISRLVYAASDPKAGAIDTAFGIGVTEGQLNHRFAVSSGVLAKRAAEQLQAFFAELRRRT
jgi:tRNA(adenine34) deaminase